MGDDTNEAKARYYQFNKTLVHVTTNKGVFYNGYILEIKSDFFMFLDRKIGKLPVFFLEVVNISPYQKRGEA